MAFESPTQATSSDLLGSLQSLGFKAANTAIDVYASKHVKMPVQPSAPQPSFQPIQKSAAPTLVSGGLSINPQMMMLIAAGFVVVLLLVKK